TAPLATGQLVEDMQLGLELAASGFPPSFCPEARVSSEFPLSQQSTVSQRTRWEHGHLAMISEWAPKLMALAVRNRDGALAAMTLDLCVPPLAWLVLASTSLVLVNLVFLVAGSASAPFILAIVNLFMIGAAVLLAWRNFGRHIVSLVELLGAPAYVLSKIPVYIGFLRNRQTEWVRTARGKKKDPDRQ
ncbi:MAG: glycosyltransferase family 2 protein, partial [Caldimonas sp.]